MELRDKVALITGGARMGQAVADNLARRGCHVALVYRSSRINAEQAARRARARGVSSLAVQADLQDPTEARRVVTQVLSRLRGLDILIHMASVYRPTPFATLNARRWQEQLDTDLRSGYLLALAAVPAMRRRKTGRIIFIADWLAASGRPRYPGFLPYYVAKRGVIGLTEALALELAPRILVNAIAPGPMLKPAGLSAKQEVEVKRSTPLGRWGGAVEMAKAVQFLIETDFVTGECLRVDGGRHLR